jgi:hypothetical protein
MLARIGESDCSSIKLGHCLRLYRSGESLTAGAVLTCTYPARVPSGPAGWRCALMRAIQAAKPQNGARGQS